MEYINFGDVVKPSTTTKLPTKEYLLTIIFCWSGKEGVDVTGNGHF